MAIKLLTFDLTWIADQLIEPFRKQDFHIRFEKKTFSFGNVANILCAVVSGPVGEIKEALESTFKTYVLGQHHLHVLRVSGDYDGHALVRWISHGSNLKQHN